MILKFDETLLSYQLTLFFKKLVEAPKYMYHWEEMAIKVRKEEIMKSDFLKIV